MRCSKLLFLPLFVFALATAAFADSIPYAHAGTIATQTAVYASSNGLNVFYMGSTAGYDDQIDVFDLNTGWDSGKILDNKATAVGTKLTVGTGAGQITAGDQLLFYIDSPDGHFASLAAYSPDGINHAYITQYAGGQANGVTIPAGLFVGMEDLPYRKSDLNYNDDDFVFSGVSTTKPAVTPEPWSVVLLSTGLLGTAVMKRRRTRNASSQSS